VTDAPFLVLDSVGKAFGPKTVLSSVFLSLPGGRITALFGRNGSGKTTLLRIAAGLLQPDYGSVRFRGESLDRPRLHRLARRGLMFLPERAFYWSRLGLGRQLELLAGAGASPGDRADRAREAAESLGLCALLSSPVGALSGGEVRKAQLAGALVRRPACLLVDEPFLSVAPIDAERIADGLRELARAGTAVVATGHEVPTLMEVCHRVAWVTSGTCYDLGTPEEARAHHSFRKEYAHRI
jgi:ABC-type multidrug transport system ATPase subunit